MRPALSSGTGFECRIKDASSIMAPVLDIHLPGFGSLPGDFNYNYCYISNFNRYYFIDDIIRDQNIWTIITHVDVLASFKADITGSSQYISRAAGAYNSDLIDSFYITKVSTGAGKVSTSKYAGLAGYGADYVNGQVVGTGTYAITKYFNVEFKDGYFIVGVVGNKLNNPSGVTFYRMNYASFKDFINKAFILNPSDMSDVTTGLANAIYNPIQYITSCRWFPSVEITLTTPSSNQIDIGRYTVTLAAGNTAHILNNVNVARYYIDIDIPKHPDASTRPYLNMPPFTEYDLYFEPFGVIPIDATKIYDQTELFIQWIVDYCSGLATLQVKPFTSSTLDNDSLIYSTTCDYGVDIPISSLSYDWKAGAVLSAAQFIKSAYISGITEGRSQPSYMSEQQWEQYQTSINNRISASSDNGFMKVINGVMDVTAGALGQLTTKGAAGSFIAYNSGAPVLYAWHQVQVGYADAKFGRPLEQYRSMTGLTGFVLCDNASISSFSNYGIKPLQPEYNMIMHYLNTGVYIE